MAARIRMPGLLVVSWAVLTIAPGCGGRADCPPGLFECGGQCVDLMTNDSHCGACGTGCGEGRVCVAAVCRDQCAGGRTACGGVCVDTRIDLENCGSCGHACDPGCACSDGACDCPPTCEELGLVTCTVDGETTCVDTDTNEMHCGGCSAACGEGEVCVDGSCVVCCGGMECGIDPLCDIDCGNCPEGEDCIDGTCVIPGGGQQGDLCALDFEHRCAHGLECAQYPGRTSGFCATLCDCETSEGCPVGDPQSLCIIQFENEKCVCGYTCDTIDDCPGDETGWECRYLSGESLCLAL